MKQEIEEQNTVDVTQLNAVVDRVLNLPVESRARKRAAERREAREKVEGAKPDDRESSI